MGDIDATEMKHNNKIIQRTAYQYIWKLGFKNELILWKIHLLKVNLEIENSKSPLTTKENVST